MNESRRNWRAITALLTSALTLTFFIVSVFSPPPGLADTGVEFGAEDDLTVNGNAGSNTDADLEVKGYSVFGNATGANVPLKVTTGAGSAFIQGDLEVKGGVYVPTSNVGIATTAPAARLDIRGSGTTSNFALRIADSLGADKLVVLDNGNVGIGTTDPRAEFHVNPSSNIEVARFESNEGNKVVINNDGAVGIGTTSPGSLLHLRTNEPIISLTDANSFTDANDRGIIRAHENNIKFQWYDDSLTTTDDLVTILQGGNVGIATTAPVARLDIRGSGTTSNFALRIADSLGTDKLVVLDKGNIGIGTTGPVSLLTVNKSGFALAEATASDYSATFSNVGNTAAAMIAGIAIIGGGTTSDGDSQIRLGSTGDNDYTAIYSSYDGTTDDDENASLTFRVADGNRVTILGNGNVGIGIVSPDYTLHVAGTAAAQTLRFGTLLDNVLPAGTGANNQVLQTNATGVISWGTVSGSGGGWADDGSMVRLSTDTDNVGIGRSDPDAKLHIFGSGTTNNFALRISDSLGADKLVVLDNGKVGIGTTAPGFPLDVNLPSTTGTSARFGATHPVYMIANWPAIGFNWYWDGASDNYGAGSTAKYPAQLGFDPSTGLLLYRNTATSGDEGAAISGIASRFAIDRNGNVGIGTASPTALLYLYGATGNSGPTMSLETADTAVAANDIVGTIELRGLDSATRPAARIRGRATGTWGADTDSAGTALEFFTQDNTNASSLGEPRMVITDVGNVGIGTTNPGEKLEVVGNIISKGTVWTTRAAAEANIWRSVTYGNGLFVAVAEDGTNRVMTSPDGINWTSRAAAEANQWNSVTYGNGLFVAVAQSGQVMTSPDGSTWTPRAAAEANVWRSVTYGNGLFVAVAQSGTNRVMTSPDGSTWTPRAAAEANVWYGVTYGNGLFVAVSVDGTNRVMTSPDGINWTSRAAAEANQWGTVTYGNGLFVAVAYSGTNRVMTSPDGSTWTPRAAAEANSWYGVTYGNGLFVATSWDGTNRVMTSPDGITWTPRAATEASAWQKVTYGNGLFVVVAGTGTNRVMTSGKSEMNIIPTKNIYQGGMVIQGNVGIGATSPSARLHLLNTSTSPGTDTLRIQTAGSDTNFALRISNTAAAELLTVLDNGNIGIGISAPAYDLDVTGNGRFTGNVTAANFYGNIPEGGGYVAGGWVDDGSRVRLSAATDNVGIGRSDPGAKLHIFGSGTTSNFALRISDSLGADKLVVLDNGKVGIGRADPGWPLDVIGIIRTSGQVQCLEVSTQSVLLSSSSFARHKFYVPANDYLILQSYNGSDWVDYLALNNTVGNLGIGTTEPLARFHIIGTGTTSNFALRIADSLGADKLVVLDNGNVGMGTTSPIAKLSIAASGTGTGIAFKVKDSDGIDKFTIADNGNVGIGLTDPLAKLSIMSSGSNTGFTLKTKDSAGNNKFVILDNGNVGIGTTNPNALLDVNGTARLGDSTTNYTAVSATGAVTYAGSARPLRTAVLTAAGAIVPASGGAGQNKTDGTNLSYYTLDYADGATQAGNWQFVVPDSFDSSTTTAAVTLLWMANATSGNCRWQVEMDGKPLDTATLFDSSLQSASATNAATNSTANALTSTAFATVTSGWAPGEAAVMKISRIGGDGGDTLSATAKLVMAKIEWLANTETD